MSASAINYESSDDGAIRNAVEVVSSFADPSIWGNQPFLPVGRDEGAHEWRAYKRFSISNLPGKTILSASLKFYYADKETDSGGPPVVDMKEIEDYVTLDVGNWNYTMRINYSNVLTNATAFGWISTDVKIALQGAINDSKNVFAFIWVPASGNEDFYAIADMQVSAYKAYLSVTYCSTPAIPTPATAQIIDVDNVRVNWTDNSSGESQETEFRIERSVDGGAYALLTTKSPNITEHIDDTVSAGHTYKYRVRAGNQAGNSNWVETDTVTPTAGGMQIYMNC